MRILWHSVAPWVSSGYGQQTAAFTPRIRGQGHDVAISAYWGLAGSVLGWEGMTVYPSDNVGGNRLLPTYAAAHGAEVTITLLDVWILKSAVLGAIDNLACWVPEDHSPLKPKALEFFERSGARPIAMARFGERVLREAGLDPLYVPHGIDTTVFRPRHELRGQTRRRLGIPEDAFVVGMVAANKGRTPSRKAFPEVLQAFAEFRRERPDAHLHLHTDPTELEQGVPMFRLIEKCGVPFDPAAPAGPGNAVTFTDPLQVELGIAPERMAAMMSSFDVLANPAYGEGFGIPVVEAQACGTPVIVTDFSAMTELCGAGWLVDADPWYDAQHGTFFGRPRPESIVARLHDAYEARGSRDLRRRARAFAADYDADRVADRYWRPALAALTPEATGGDARTPGGLVLPQGVTA